MASEYFYETIALIDDLFDLSEGREKSHNPFRRWRHLGNKTPGKRSGADEKGDWECHKKGKYVQVCKGVGPSTEGRTKIVHIDKAWKSKYNHEIKTGTSSGKYSPAVRSKHNTSNKSKGGTKAA